MQQYTYFLASLKRRLLNPFKHTFLAFILFSLLFHFYYHVSSSITISCIHIAQLTPPAPSLGSLYARTQLAFFLSSHLSAKLSVASHTPFDKCPPPQPSCILQEKHLMLPRCDRADCACHSQKIAPYLKSVSHCTTLQLIFDNPYSTTEFSGCTGQTVTRYTPPQKGTYNVLVYSGSGAISMTESEAKYIQKQLCTLSDNQIVVVAATAKRVVPICENRTILAPKLDDEAIVRLIAGAEMVGVKGGANVHMGVAGMNGGRLILPSNSVVEFDWAPVQAFTIVGTRGTVFHFDDVQIMRAAISSGSGIDVATVLERTWSYRGIEDEQDHPEQKLFVWDIPKRYWTGSEDLT